MKKFGIFILGLCTVFFVGNVTQAKDYEYTNLDITANILIDGTINIKEDFTANFFVKKHGIIREIPLNYSIGGKDFHLEIFDIDVDGNNFTTTKKNGNIEIKIGDANKTIIGEKKYPISYSTYGLIRNFSGMGYAELSRILVGHEFDTNINKVKAEIILPKVYTGFTKEDFLITTDGTNKTIDGFEGTVNRSQGDRIIITYNKGLSAKHGITLAIKFPNNYFTFDHNRQANLIGNIGDNGSESSGIISKITETFFGAITIGFVLIILISPIILLVIFIKFIIKIIKNHGNGIKKEFKDKYPTIIQYDPPKGLNSAEVGILLHRYEDPKDTFSLIYKRANEHLIKIEVNDEDITSLIKLKDIPGDYQEYEKKLFKNLFHKDELKLDHKTYLYKKLINSGIKEYGIEKGRFVKKKTNNDIGCLIVALIFFGTPILSVISPAIGFIYFFAVIFIIVACGENRLNGKTLEETEEGAKLISHILGYKIFIKTCDENKLRTFLQKDPLYFDKILPYAVVFGLETELIDKIKPIMEEKNIKPTRYNGDLYSLSDTAHTISTMAYSQRISSSSSSYSSSSGFDSGSSFDSDFGSDSGGGGGGGSSW